MPVYYKWKFLIVFIVVKLQLIEIIGAPLNDNADLEFIILHNNDMHARFEETGARSIKCSQEESIKNLCYGGFARISYKVKQYRELAKQSGGSPVLYLNAGDTYTGTPWFTIFKNNITVEFLNFLQPDAMSLGNHEFDEGIEGLIPLLDSVKFPVVASNLNLEKVPQLATSQSLRKSAVFVIKGIKIGVIGYLTPDTKVLTFPNDVDYYPEIESINREAKVLRDMGVKILIALGHSGFIKDKEIAKQCPDIDLVIGGHTNTFLYNGKPPDIEQPEGPYPVIVQQADGKKVPVVQAYAYTKYLGYLQVKFNNDGDLISWNGQPILLDSKIPQDPDALQLLEKYRPNITELENIIIGHTLVDLEGRSEFCRAMECNLGNMIADALVHTRILIHRTNNEGWTDAAIGLIQGGGIRSSISKRSDGAITKTDLVSVLPFNNQLYMVEVSGKILKNALERSASLLGVDSNGGFLQMSGVQVVYDISKPIGQRVTEVNVKCANCDIPEYFKLDENKNYKIILNAFILAGGDGYKWTDSSGSVINSTPTGYTELEAVTKYIQDKSPIYTGVESRIKIINNFEKNGSEKLTNHGILIISIAVFLNVVCNMINL